MRKGKERKKAKNRRRSKKTRATHCNVSDKIDYDIYSKNKKKCKEKETKLMILNLKSCCCAFQLKTMSTQSNVEKKNRFLFCVQMYFWLQFFP